jgi:hypothetical protein
VQRYGAAHEAQSGWTTAKQTTKNEGGGRAAVFGTKLRKKREKCELSRCSMTKTKKKLPHYTFLRDLSFYFFFYSFFRQLESHNGLIL